MWIDREICSYADMTIALRQQYSRGNMAVGEYFPHEQKNITETQLSAKLPCERMAKMVKKRNCCHPKCCRVDGVYVALRQTGNLSCLTTVLAFAQ